METDAILPWKQSLHLIITSHTAHISEEGARDFIFPLEFFLVILFTQPLYNTSFFLHNVATQEKLALVTLISDRKK